MKHNLHAIAFPGLTGENSALISVQSSALLRRDQNAPIYITQDDLNKWEKRNDITSLRAQYKEAKKDDRLLAEGIKARIKYLLDYLEKLQLELSRRTYFEEVDRLRAHGQSTEHLRNGNATDLRRTRPVVDAAAASCIGVILQKALNPEVTIKKVTAYLKGKSEKEILSDSLELEPHLQARPDLNASNESRCLLCDFPYSNVSSLTRHVRRHHEFSKPFNCPECLRNGNVHNVSGIPSAWSNHAKQFHGKIHTPNLWSEKLEKPAYCPICQGRFTMKGFSTHFNNHQRTLKLPYDCQECLRGDAPRKPPITTFDDLVLHIRHDHDGGYLHGAILKTDACEKRTREDESSGSNNKRLKLSLDQGISKVGSSSDISSYEWEMP